MKMLSVLMLLMFLSEKSESRHYEAEIVFPDGEKKIYEISNGKDFPKLKVNWECQFNTSKIDKDITGMSLLCNRIGNTNDTMFIVSRCIKLEKIESFSLPIMLVLTSKDKIVDITVLCK